MARGPDGIATGAADFGTSTKAVSQLEVDRVTQEVITRQQAMAGGQGGGGGGGGGGVLGRLIRRLALAVGALVLTQFRGSNEAFTRPARRTQAQGFQDWRWTLDDMAEGLQTFVQEMDAAWQAAMPRIFDPGVAESLPWLHVAVNTLTRRLYHEATGDIIELRAAAATLTRRLYDPDSGSIPLVQTQIATLTERLFGQPGGWIWRLGASIQTLSERLYHPVWGDVPVIQQHVEAQAQRTTTLERGRIVPLEGRMSRSESRQDNDDSWLNPMRLLLPVAAATTVIPILLRNEDKLAANCRWDLDDVLQMLDQLLLVFGLAGLIEALRETADSTDELFGLVRPFIT